MKPVRKRPEFKAVLANIYSWIGSRNLHAADRFLLAVDSTLQQIAKHPQLGWARRWRHPNLVGIRSWRVNHFENFLIFYREAAETIEVHAVLRGARHLDRALRDR